MVSKTLQVAEQKGYSLWKKSGVGFYIRVTLLLITGVAVLYLVAENTRLIEDEMNLLEESSNSSLTELRHGLLEAGVEVGFHGMKLGSHPAAEEGVGGVAHRGLEEAFAVAGHHLEIG